MVVDPHEVGRCGATAYWGCPANGGVGFGPRRRWMGSVGDWPMARPTTEHQGATAPSGRRMAEAGRRVLLLGRLSHTAHSGCSAADGCPGERRGGKRNAFHGAAGPACGVAGGAPLAVPTSNLEISPALKHAPVANPGER